MRLEWLEYFSDAARLGSIKASADKHNISPQGLSKCIRSLEAELGVKLFERDANSVRLTSEGASLLDQVRVSIDAVHKLVRQAHGIAHGNEKTPLAILCSSFVFLCGMMRPLREGVELAGRTASFEQMHTNELFAALDRRSDSLSKGRTLCGVPILFSPLREQNREALRRASLNGYDYLPFLAYRDGALVSAKHSLGSAGSISLAQLDGYPVVSSSVEQLAPLSSFLGAGRITSAIADLETRLQVIQDDESVIFLPPFSAAAADDRFRFLPVEDGYEVEIGFLYDRNEVDATEARTLLAPTLGMYGEYEQAGLCQITLA